MYKSILAILLLMTLNACATHRFIAKEPVAGGTLESTKLDSFGWSIIEETDTPFCATDAFVEIRVKKSFFKSLINVVSLGFYDSTKIEYRCAKLTDEGTNIGDTPIKKNSGE